MWTEWHPSDIKVTHVGDIQGQNTQHSYNSQSFTLSVAKSLHILYQDTLHDDVNATVKETSSQTW